MRVARGWCVPALACLLAGCGLGDHDRAAIGGSLPEDGTEGSSGSGDEASADTGRSDESSGGSSGTGDADDVNAYIFSLPHFDVDPWQPQTETPCLGFGCPHDGAEGDQTCVYVHYSETADTKDFVAFQPNSATLWPGNVVQGVDAQEGLLTPVGLPRAPMTFSVSLENLEGSPVGHMQTPSLSAFREQRNQILGAGTDGPVPAQIAYDITRVYEADQVAVSLGGSVDWFGGGVSSMFEFGDTTRSTKILVDFTQAYYTIDVDTPGLPADFFTDEVTVDLLHHYTSADNPPMYVQSITYGRRVLFSVESTSSEEDIRFAFDASFDAVLFGGGVDVGTQYSSILQQSKMSALVLGGSGADAVKTVVGFDGLVDYITDGADYSKDSPGAPIAYKLAYLDNSGVELSFTTDYSERQCYDSEIDVTAELARVDYQGGNDDGPGSIDLYGTLDFRVAPATDPDPCRPDAPDWIRFFDRGSGGAQLVPGIWLPQTPIEKTVYDFEVDLDDSLCIRGELKDADDCWFCSDDDFGAAGVGPIPLHAGWPGDYPIEFSKDGTVVATIRISVD